MAAWRRRRLQAGLQDEAEGDADGNGDQGGDREPQQGPPDQAGGVLQLAQIGDGGDDGGEDQRRHQRAQQLDEDRADGGQRLGQPVGIAGRVGPHLAGDIAEEQADHHGGENLEAEMFDKAAWARAAPGQKRWWESCVTCK